MKNIDIDTFTVKGHGGGGKDTSNTGVRLTHRESGATGKGTETRNQTRNKVIAFQKLIASDKFKSWHRLEIARRSGQAALEEIVDNMMSLYNLKIETKDMDGKWIKDNG